MIGNLIQLQMMASATPALVTLMLLPALIAGHPALASQRVAYLPVIAVRERVASYRDELSMRQTLRAERRPRRAVTVEPAKQVVHISAPAHIAYAAPLYAQLCRAP